MLVCHRPFCHGTRAIFVTLLTQTCSGVHSRPFNNLWVLQLVAHSWFPPNLLSESRFSPPSLGHHSAMWKSCLGLKQTLPTGPASGMRMRYLSSTKPQVNWNLWTIAGTPSHQRSLRCFERSTDQNGPIGLSCSKLLAPRWSPPSRATGASERWAIGVPFCL